MKVPIAVLNQQPKTL